VVKSTRAAEPKAIESLLRGEWDAVTGITF